MLCASSVNRPTVYFISRPVNSVYFISRSVFNKAVRTNNDVEGWHRRINSKAGRSQLDLYRLLDLLSDEALLVKVELDLLRDSRVTRDQRT